MVKEVTRTDESSDAPVMMITANDGFINQSERYSTDNAGQSLKKYILLHKGELAYNHGASKLRPYGSCFALTTEKNARIPFVYHCFSSEIENPEFLSVVLNGRPVEGQLRKIVSSGARMDGLLNISYEEYTSIPVMMPEKAEQDKIADFFRGLDKVITLHQCKCKKLICIKKSMLENMFPQKGEKIPRIRFSGFTDDWEQRKVADIASDTRGGGTPTTSNRAYWDGEIPWIQSSDLSDGKVFGIEPRKHISRAGLNNSATQLVPEASIAIVTRVGVGKLAFIPYSYTTSQDFLSLCRLQTEPYFSVYSLYQMLQGELQAVQGTSIKGMTRDDLLSKSIIVPKDKDEQQQIGLYFRSIDHLITLHQRELEKLQNIKKAMLEKMFV